MQVKQDWLQRTLLKLLAAPLSETRVGEAHTVIGHFEQFDLNLFPATTSKKLAFETVKRELYCFLKGLSSKEDFHKHGLHIWDDNMMRVGAQDIGPIYGRQWRNWAGWFDQLNWSIQELLITDGTSRRSIVSSWNPVDILYGGAVLPPCPVLYQFNYLDGKLYIDVYQRSADAFLGLPFDVASFALLVRLVKNTLLERGFAREIYSEQLNYHVANLHLYKEHVEAARQALNNNPTEEPTLLSYCTVDNFHYGDAWLLDYNETRSIKAKLLT